MFQFNPYMFARPAGEMSQQMIAPNLGFGGMNGLGGGIQSAMAQQPGLNIAQHPQMVQQMQGNPMAALQGGMPQPAQQSWFGQNRGLLGNAMYQIAMNQLR